MDNLDHADMTEDQIQFMENIKPIVTVMQQMLDKIALMDEELDSLTKLVNEEIIGGITNLYNSKCRLSGISELQAKYGELMGPYKDFYSELTDGSDIYEKLYDELEEFKSSAEDIDDAAVDAKIRELADILKSKFDKIKGLDHGVVAVKVSEVKEPEVSDTDKLLQKVKAMKAKAGDNFKF